MTALQPGDRLGDWVIERALGAGGMGSVHLAHSVLSTDVRAAVKTLLPSALGDVEARFVGEMRTLAALSHPAIVRVLGGGRDESRKLLYMAMELVDGHDLADRLAEGPIPSVEAARIFAPIADALRYAHSRGVFHRDIKPANLMLRADGSPVLVDFGIAVAQGQTRMTRAGTVPGTLAYLPPEVFQGEEPDPLHTDVYALGVTLFEALTGADAFPTTAEASEGQRMATIMGRKVRGDALDPGAGAGALRDLVRGITAPEREDRLVDLDTICDVLESARPATGRTGAQRPRTAPVPRKKKRGWSGCLLAVGGGVVLLAGLGLVGLAVAIAGGAAAWVAYQPVPVDPSRPPVDLAEALALGTSALERGDLAKAYDQAGLAIDDHPADPNANLLYGQVLLRRDQARLARAYLCAAADRGLSAEVPGLAQGAWSCERGPGAREPVSARLAIARLEATPSDVEALSTPAADALADAGAPSPTADIPKSAPVASSSPPRRSAPAAERAESIAPRASAPTGSGSAAGSPPTGGGGGPTTADAAAEPTSLDPAVTRRVIAGAQRSVQACYNRARERKPRLAGRLTVRVVIGPQGSVSGASVVESTLDARVMEQCVLDVLQTLSFPAAEASTVTRHTFQFAPE